MTELRFRIEDDFLTDLQAMLGQPLRPVDMVREALTLLYWAAEQRRQGLVILAGTKDGKGQLILSQPVLNRVPLDPPAPEKAAAIATAVPVAKAAGL